MQLSKRAPGDPAGKNDRARLKPVDRNEVIAKHLVKLRPSWLE